jgi:hypothetical protein
MDPIINDIFDKYYNPATNTLIGHGTWELQVGYDGGIRATFQLDDDRSHGFLLTAVDRSAAVQMWEVTEAD